MVVDPVVGAIVHPPQPPPHQPHHAATQEFPFWVYHTLQVIAQVVAFTLPFDTEAGLQGRETSNH